MRELTEQQAAFVREFSANGGKGTEAAIRAGFSKTSAAQRSYELRQKPHVQEAINRELRRSFTELAAIAVDQARMMLVDSKTPASARVDLIKSVCDRAGLAALRDGAEGLSADKPLHQLSLAELEAMAARLGAQRGERESVTDVH